jgi:hypothetical protein
VPASGANSTVESVLALLVNQPQLAGEFAKLESERDEYKKQYLLLLEAYRKLELGLVGQKRERFIGAPGQAVFQALLDSQQSCRESKWWCCRRR